jgi:hypothetical protein
MARRIDWTKDRQRQLSRAATACEIEERNIAEAFHGRKKPARPKKVSDRGSGQWAVERFGIENITRFKERRGRAKGAQPRLSAWTLKSAAESRDHLARWLVTCPCGKRFTVEAELCEASLEKSFSCSGCKKTHRLRRNDLDPPWD